MFITKKSFFIGSIIFIFTALVATPPIWWFCLWTAPLQISTETTFITKPLTSDGKQIDYFQALENLLNPSGMKTNNNGYRLFLRSFGLPKHEFSSDSMRKQFYEKLGLDPVIDAEPTHSISTVYAFLERDDWRAYDSAGHWTLENFPTLADWLAENSDGIDQLSKILRTSIFHVPIVRDDKKSVSASLLGIQNLSLMQQYRSFARTVAGRARYRIGIGDIDGAIEDILTIHRLGRHVANQGMIIHYLVGFAIEGVANDIAIKGNSDYPPTTKQLKHFIQELHQLPSQIEWSAVCEGERLFSLGALQELFESKNLTDWKSMISDDPKFQKWIFKISDANTIFKIVNQAYDRVVVLETENTDWETANRHWNTLRRQFRNPFRYLTVQSRSKQIANALVDVFTCNFDGLLNNYQRCECLDRLKRLTLALLLYEAEYGSMPVGDWREAVKPYLGDTPEKYFYCPSDGTGYALVLTDDPTPETPLLVETRLENMSENGTIANDPALFTEVHILGMRLAPQLGISGFIHTSYRNGVVRSVRASPLPPRKPCC